MLRRALLSAVLLAPCLVSAQVTITETGDKPDRIVNIAECRGDTGAASTIGMQWNITNVTFSQVEVRISDTSGCPTSDANSAAHTSSLGTFTGNNNTTSLSAPDAMSRINIPAASCASGANITVNVCVIPRDAAGTVITNGTVTGTVLLDRTIPGKPNPPTVAPGDGALRMSWPAASGSSLSYRVELRPSDTPDVLPIRSEEVTGLSVRVSGLEIGREYLVTLVVISQGGNESTASDPAIGIPAAVNDFWEIYQGAGGVEQGGCSTAGAGTLALLAFVPFALRRRRS